VTDRNKHFRLLQNEIDYGRESIGPWIAFVHLHNQHILGRKKLKQTLVDLNLASDKCLLTIHEPAVQVPNDVKFFMLLEWMKKTLKTFLTSAILSKSTKMFLSEHFALNSGSDVTFTVLSFSSQTSLVDTPSSAENR